MRKGKYTCKERKEWSVNKIGSKIEPLNSKTSVLFFQLLLPIFSLSTPSNEFCVPLSEFLDLKQMKKGVGTAAAAAATAILTGCEVKNIKRFLTDDEILSHLCVGGVLLYRDGWRRNSTFSWH